MEEFINDLRSADRVIKYNTELKKIRKSEYGRTIQRMVDGLMAIEDREKRTEQARAVIRSMESINPEVRKQENFEHKLWDDLYIISDFKLDVDSPYPMPTKEQIAARPLPMKIEKSFMKAMQYGRNIEAVISLISELENGDLKTSLIRSLAIYMRQQYLTWNKESVADETIFDDIVRLSNGKIEIPDGLELFRIKPDAVFARPGVVTKSRQQAQKKQKQNKKRR